MNLRSVSNDFISFQTWTSGGTYGRLRAPDLMESFLCWYGPLTSVRVLNIYGILSLKFWKLSASNSCSLYVWWCYLFMEQGRLTFISYKFWTAKVQSLIISLELVVSVCVCVRGGVAVAWVHSLGFISQTSVVTSQPNIHLQHQPDDETATQYGWLQATHCTSSHVES